MLRRPPKTNVRWYYLRVSTINANGSPTFYRSPLIAVKNEVNVIFDEKQHY